MQVRVTYAVYKAVYDLTRDNQVVQEEVCSKLIEAVKTVILVVDDTCDEPAFEVDLRAEDIRDLDEPILQMVLPATGTEVTKEKC